MVLLAALSYCSICGSCYNDCTAANQCLCSDNCAPGFQCVLWECVCFPGGSYCNGACQLPTCCNNQKDNNEGDIDCGAACFSKCAAGQTCQSNSDCATNNCAGGVCQ